MGAWADNVAAAAACDFVREYMSRPDPCPTGIAPLDAILGGGLPVGGVTVVGGDPGTGKTSLGVQIVYSAALRGLKPTYVSIEMPAMACLLRMCSLHAAYTPALPDFSWGSATPTDEAREQVKRIRENAQDARQAERYITELSWRYVKGDDPVMQAWRDLEGKIGGAYAVRDDVRDLGDICNLIRDLDADDIYGPVVIDYSQLVTTADGQEEYTRMTEVSRRLQEASKGTGVPVVLISSLRKIARTERDSPSLDWFRGSGYLGYDAYCALFLFRDEEGDAMGRGNAPDLTGVRAYVKKNRNGRSDVECALDLDGAHNRFMSRRQFIEIDESEES